MRPDYVQYFNCPAITGRIVMIDFELDKAPIKPQLDSYYVSIVMTTGTVCTVSLKNGVHPRSEDTRNMVASSRNYQNPVDHKTDSYLRNPEP